MHLAEIRDVGAALDLLGEVSLLTGANTVAIATLTQASIGPSSASVLSAAASMAAASATSVGIASA